jgi:hypothetical protein
MQMAGAASKMCMFSFSSSFRLESELIRFADTRAGEMLPDDDPDKPLCLYHGIS